MSINQAADQGLHNPARLPARFARRFIQSAALLGVTASTTLAAPATPGNDQTSFATAPEVQQAILSMEREMKPGQGFHWRPLVRGGSMTAALEYWKAPGRPAVHPAEAEYAIVVAGSGTLVSGGQLVAASVKRPGLTEGSRIDGGTTRTLRTGDVFVIPAGVPHWFGITGGKLVLLGTKVPQ